MSVSEVCAKRDESKESPLWSSNRDAFCAQGSSCRVDTGVSAQLSTGSPGSYLLPGAELHFFCAHCSYKIIISDYENQLQDYENPSWGERKRPHSSRMRGWGFFSPEHMNSISDRNESQSASTWGNIWGVRTKGPLNDNQSFYQPITVAKCFCCRTVVWHMHVNLPKKISHLNRTEKSRVPVQYIPDFS